MSIPKSKQFPSTVMVSPLLPLIQSCAGVLAINWVFQGLRGMDPKERLFRLGCESMLALLVAASLWSRLSPASALLTGVFVAHSLNFLLNGQFWVCLRYCQLYRNSEGRLNHELARLTSQLRSLPWLAEAVVIGSSANGHVRSARSDIDLRIITPRGFLGWIRANLLLFRLRSMALLRILPLDLYAYDAPESLQKFNPDEPVWILRDDDGRLESLFHGRQVRR